MLWAYGLCDALHGGLQPGNVLRNSLRRYPLQEVVLTCVIITLELAVLYAILRPATFHLRQRRAISALTMFIPLAVEEFFLCNGGTDQPGYACSNAHFLHLALLLLLAILSLDFLARRPKPDV